MHAVRNIRLCTKDCLCLYVCPTGATDTETGQVDASKCIGCGICANACPSGAISMVLEKYPPQQKKEEDVYKRQDIRWHLFWRRPTILPMPLRILRMR